MGSEVIGRGIPHPGKSRAENYQPGNSPAIHEGQKSIYGKRTGMVTLGLHLLTRYASLICHTSD